VNFGIQTLAVLFAIAGVIVVSLDAEFAGNPLGIALAVLSAACAAFYKVQAVPHTISMKVKRKKQNSVG
jgi:drug/metabolite transporter (DMT)-like permease